MYSHLSGWPAYTLYLKLRSLNCPAHEIETYVRRWLVMSILTGRYSGSPESQFDHDIRQIASRPFTEFLKDIEDAELSDAFWNASLVQRLNSAVASSPYLHVFWAAQVKLNDKGFLSRDITVNDLITHKGDIHHIFPRDYLKKSGLKRGDYKIMVGLTFYAFQEVRRKVARS